MKPTAPAHLEAQSSEQLDESSARIFTKIGFGLGLVAMVGAVLVAPFASGVWVLTAAAGLVAMVCGLAGRNQSTRAGQWQGLAGFAAVLGGVAIVASFLTQLAV